MKKDLLEKQLESFNKDVHKLEQAIQARRNLNRRLLQFLGKSADMTNGVIANVSRSTPDSFSKNKAY